MSEILQNLASSADAQAPVFWLITFLSVIAIAATSIGIECYNSTDFNKGRNKQFLALILTVSILALVGSGGGIVLSYVRKAGVSF
jgi:hypothetical protein